MADERQAYTSRTWQTGDVITKQALNNIENEMGYVSAEINNAVTGTINSDKVNDTLARKLDSVVKYFPNTPNPDTDLEYVRMYAQPSTEGTIIVPTEEEYLKFKQNFVQPFTNKAYTAGSYVEYEDEIYKVKSAIAKNNSAADDAAAWAAILALDPSPIRKINVMQEVDNLINVYTSDSQLTPEQNRIWIQQPGESVEVPSYEEFTSLSNSMDDLKSAVGDQYNQIIGNKINLYQGAIYVSGDDAGKPAPTYMNRVYTQPFCYGDHVELNDGYYFITAVTYIDGVFSAYASISQQTINTQVSTPGSSVRYVIAKADRTQNISPSENIIKSFNLISSNASESNIKTISNAIDQIRESAVIETQRISARIQGTTGTYYNRNDNSESMIVNIKPNDVITFKVGNGNSYFAMLKSYADNQGTPDFATGYSGIGELVSGSINAVAPSDAKYLIVLLNVGGSSDRTPQEINVNGFNILHTIPVNVGDNAEGIKRITSIISNININTFEISARIQGGRYTRNDNSRSLIIEIKPGEHVTFKTGNGNSYFAMLTSYNDSQSTPAFATGYSNFGVLVTDDVDAIAPNDAKYLIVLLNVGGTSDRTPAEINIDGFNVFNLAIKNIGLNAQKIAQLNKAVENITIKTTDMLIEENSGYADGELKWLAIGDSYTEINDTTNSTIRNFIEKGYMDRVCEALPQLECTNAGHSGNTFINWNNRFDEIVGGYDLYTIMLGTNDWSQDALWGTVSDFTNRDRTKSLGVLGAMIDKIHQVAPKAKLIVMTQLHRTVGIVPGATTIAARNHDTYLPNASGLYFADMEKDIIDCCKQENIEYVDIFTESHVTPRNAMKFAKVDVNGTLTYLRYPDYLQYIVYDQTVTNPYDATTYWAEYDGVHPSKIGMQIIADLLVKKLRTYLFE